MASTASKPINIGTFTAIVLITSSIARPSKKTAIASEIDVKITAISNCAKSNLDMLMLIIHTRLTRTPVVLEGLADAIDKVVHHLRGVLEKLINLRTNGVDSLPRNIQPFRKGHHGGAADHIGYNFLSRWNSADRRPGEATDRCRTTINQRAIDGAAYYRGVRIAICTRSDSTVDTARLLEYLL